MIDRGLDAAHKTGFLARSRGERSAAMCVDAGCAARGAADARHTRNLVAHPFRLEGLLRSDVP
jgi:hypothetical protein